MGNASGLPAGTYGSSSPPLPQRLETGVLSSGLGWNKQQILPAALSFLRQGTLRGARVILGRRTCIARNRISVCSTKFEVYWRRRLRRVGLGFGQGENLCQKPCPYRCRQGRGRKRRA